MSTASPSTRPSAGSPTTALIGGAKRLPGALLREVYRREAIPVRLRWWLAASGMRDWFRWVARSLAPYVEATDETARKAGARALVADLAAETLQRRYDALRQHHVGAALPDRHADPRAVALLMSALYRMELAPRRARWIFDDVGGVPRSLAERARAQRLAWPLDVQARWEELTVHLGEWLIVLTEQLPDKLPRARQIVAQICFDAGVRYAHDVSRWFGLRRDGTNDAALAIEVLRTSEYIFRVNPSHWGDVAPGGRAGYIEGNACPWYDRPGWVRGHCGIFGQFQAGVASCFDLRYKLTKTIPKHGGNTCRVDLVPLDERSATATASA